MMIKSLKSLRVRRAVIVLLALPLGVSLCLGQKPPVPSNSIYLGAWVLPDGHPAGGGSPTGNELLSLSAFQTAIHNQISVLHVYTTGWDVPVDLQALDKIAKNGSIPLIDWRCTSQLDIIKGDDDGFIASYARSLANFRGPVFLRWFWGMNISDAGNKRCAVTNADYPDLAANYTNAWRHIWNVFQSVGATNVAFVWCPALPHLKTSDAYYPGDQYVDWIAVNGYDRKGTQTFSDIFANFYDYMVAAHDKPIMIAEAGTLSFDQAKYLHDIQNGLRAHFPKIKALVYYDGKEAPGDWTLGNDGLAAFRSLADDPYFAFHEFPQPNVKLSSTRDKLTLNRRPEQ